MGWIEQRVKMYYGDSSSGSGMMVKVARVWHRYFDDNDRSGVGKAYMEVVKW